MTINVLFICQGNVGRSQIAEAFYNHKHKKHKAISAGIDDVGHKYDYKPYSPIIKIMKEEYAIDISKQTVKQISKQMVESAEYIILLTRQAECQNTIPDYIQKHQGLINHPIQDPQHKIDGDIKNVIKDICKIIEKLT